MKDRLFSLANCFASSVGTALRCLKSLLFSDQHDHNVTIRMISQFFQPSCHILICLVFANIVHQQCSDSTSIVGRSDGSIPLLTGCIPDLRFDCFGIDLNAAGGKFDTDSGLAVEVELIASESRKQVRLSYAGVSDEDHLEEEIIFVVCHIAGRHLVEGGDSLALFAGLFLQITECVGTEYAGVN